MRRHYVYALVDLDTGLAMYIGMAARPKTRYLQHLKEHGASRKCTWVQVKIKEGKTPRLLILSQHSTEYSARQFEQLLIATYIDDGINLVNTRHCHPL